MKIKEIGDNDGYGTPLFKEFYDTIDYGMRRLLNDGRKPLTVKDIMELRLKTNDMAITSDRDVDACKSRKFTTGTPAFCNTKGDILIASYDRNKVAKELIREFGVWNSKFDGGRVVKVKGMGADDMFDAVKRGGPHLIVPSSIAESLQHSGCCVSSKTYEDEHGNILPAKGYVAGLYNEPTTRQKVWEFLAEGDPQLCEDYGSLIREFPFQNYFDYSPRFSKVPGIRFRTSSGFSFLDIKPIEDGSTLEETMMDRDPDWYKTRLIGVREDLLESRIQAPKPSQVLGIINNPDFNRKGMSEAISKLYTGDVVNYRDQLLSIIDNTDLNREGQVNKVLEFYSDK